jgi:hypothetical protein
MCSTSRLNLAEIIQTNPAATDPMPHLRTFLPGAVQEFFFGDSDPPEYDARSMPSVVSRHRAFRTAAMRAVPVVNVYVLMDRDDDLRAISFLLSHMPVKVYRLRPADFLLGPLKCEPLLEEPSERLAAVKGALAMNDVKLPAMVVLAGPAVVTVTTITVDHQVAGMGTSCGITSKIRMMASHEDGDHAASAADSSFKASPAPSIATQNAQLLAFIGNVKARGTPIDLFGGTEMEQQLGSALYETGAYLTATVAKWKEDAKKQIDEARPDPSVETADAKDLAVVVCGVDSDLVEAVLSSNHANVISPPVVGHPEGGTRTIVCRNLVSKGVQALLVAKYDELMKACESSDEERARRTALGCRVAKKFGSRAYRGTVVSVAVSGAAFDDDLYQVMYDDGDEEDYYPFEIYGTTGGGCVRRAGVDSKPGRRQRSGSQRAHTLFDSCRVQSTCSSTARSGRAGKSATQSSKSSWS